MRCIGQIIFALAILLLSTFPVWSQRSNLHADPKLHRNLRIVDRNPTLESLFAKLETATKFKLTLDEKLTGHQPKFGRLQVYEAEAWSVMAMIAKVGLQDGRWEKTAEGYRLAAKGMIEQT